MNHNAVSRHRDISVASEFQIKLEDSSNNYIEWQTRSRGKCMWQEVTNRVLQKKQLGLTLLGIIVQQVRQEGRLPGVNLK